MSAHSSCALIRQKSSRRPCTHNVSYGCEPEAGRMWVRGGCRGWFLCSGVRLLCAGKGPWLPEYCSCASTLRTSGSDDPGLSMGFNAAQSSYACGRTAYASLLTEHANGTSTYLSKLRGRTDDKLATQARLSLVLLRSIRRIEQCRRDFLLMLGTGSTLRDSQREAFDAEGAIIRRVPPIQPGVPSMDKLNALLFYDYSLLLVIDADVLVLQPLDSLLEPLAWAKGQLVMAHHPYDVQQGITCGVPMESRAIGALFVVQPDAATSDALMAKIATFDREHLMHYSEQTAIWRAMPTNAACCAHCTAATCMISAPLP